jgi:hypothetical protein
LGERLKDLTRTSRLAADCDAAVAERDTLAVERPRSIRPLAEKLADLMHCGQ